MSTVLTDNEIKGLLARAKKHGKTILTFDAVVPGLILKTTPVGRAIWILNVRFPGNKREAKRRMGLYSKGAEGNLLGIAAARQKAVEWRKDVVDKVDPKAKEKRERDEAEKARKAKEAAEEAERLAHEAANRFTFKFVVDAYNKHRKAEGHKRAEKDAKDILRHLVPTWGSKPIVSIDHTEVKRLLSIIDKRSPWVASHMWTHCTGIFSFAVEGWLDDETHEMVQPMGGRPSPMVFLKKKKVVSTKKMPPSDRWLSDDEIWALWESSHADEIKPMVGIYYRLLLLTGCRLNELQGARWNELHTEVLTLLDRPGPWRLDWSKLALKDRTWTIPPYRSKSGHVFVIPLTDRMFELLRELRAMPQRPGCMFMFTHEGRTKPMHVGSKIKRQLDALMRDDLQALAEARPARKGSGPKPVTLERWTNHTFRHTVRTNLSQFKMIEEHVREKTIGHGRKGIKRVYDNYAYLDEMHAAFVAWDKRVMEIITARRALVERNEPAALQPAGLAAE